MQLARFGGLDFDKERRGFRPCAPAKRRDRRFSPPERELGAYIIFSQSEDLDFLLPKYGWV